MDGKRVLSGQAVVDGVLMLFGEKYVCVVKGYKKTEILEGDLPIKRDPWLKIPFIRGIVALFLTMYIGLKALSFSTDKADEDGFGLIPMILTVAVSITIALLLFKLVPFLLAGFLTTTDNPALFNLLDGAFRVSIFLLYLYAVSFMDDVKQMFEYHGAEHKVINSYEATGKFTKTAAKKASRFHSRCSTSFVILILLIAILVFALVPLSLPFWHVIGVRLLLFIPIASISYEFIKILSANEKNPIAKVFMAPGFFVQHITTREPSDEQLSLALLAARRALKAGK